MGSMNIGEREEVGVGVNRANMGKIEVGMSIGVYEGAGVMEWMEGKCTRKGLWGDGSGRSVMV